MLKLALLGRTRWLLDAGHLLMNNGHEISLIVTSKAERFYGVAEKEFASLAKDAGAEFYENLKLNSAEGYRVLQNSGAELGVSVNWPSLIKRKACSALPLGILNAHAGDLPRYRGNACPNWAILNGEKEVGLCVHYMDPDSLDSGDVLARDFFSLYDDSYIGGVYAWLDQRVPTMFVEAVNGLESGDITPLSQPQAAELSLRCYPRKPEDSRINWTMPVESVYRLIRASSEPFGGAFTMLDNGERVIIWEAEPFKHIAPFCAVPGQVLFSEGLDPVIACGDGAIKLTKVSSSTKECNDMRSVITKSLRNRLV